MPCLYIILGMCISMWLEQDRMYIVLMRQSRKWIFAQGIDRLICSHFMGQCMNCAFYILLDYMGLMFSIIDFINLRLQLFILLLYLLDFCLLANYSQLFCYWAISVINSSSTSTYFPILDGHLENIHSWYWFQKYEIITNKSFIAWHVSQTNLLFNILIIPSLRVNKKSETMCSFLNMILIIEKDMLLKIYLCVAYTLYWRHLTINFIGWVNHFVKNVKCKTWLQLLILKLYSCS